ncbi:hypothetical protein D3C87_188980 [compost metagenome]
MKTLFAKSIALIFLLSSLSAQAGLLAIENSPEKLEKVTLGKAAVAQIEDQAVPLTAVGAGLRSKKVVFVNVRVYVGQLFASDIPKFKFSETEALDSIHDQKAVAIQLHFLRDVDADNVQKSFKEALTANGVKLDESGVKQFLEAVSSGGEAKEGKALTILGAKLKDGSEVVFYETTSGNVSQIKGSAGFVKNIFSIWLGKPSDDGVAKLKKSIVQLK